MRQYEMMEWVWEVPKGEHRGLSMKLWKGDRSWELDGFYYGEKDGKGRYCVRFYPKETGRYHYRVSGAVKESGTVDCAAGDGQSHGLVRADQTHFRYEDGSWYYPFGTTVYAMVHQPQELIDQTMETLSEAPFNKVRMCLFPKDFDYNRNEPELFPFERDGQGGWDMTRPCLLFWERLEERIRQLDQMGIQCDLILLHPYDRWGFSRLSREQVLCYFDYTVRRLAAFPNIWWSLANEYDVLPYAMEDWEYFADTLRRLDPYGHLLSNHQMVIPWDFSNKDTSHICLQLKNVEDVSRYVSRYQKPLMVDECCYEGNIPMDWGNISAFSLVNRFWLVMTQGGYATHGETFLDDKDIIWWAKGGILKGESPKRIRFLKELVDSFPGPLEYLGHDITEQEVEYMKRNPPKEMEHTPFMHLAGKVTWEQIRQMLLESKQYEAHVRDEIFLTYYGIRCVGEGTLKLPTDHWYRVERIQVWDMTRETVAKHVCGNVTISLPGREGMALLASRE